MNRTFLSGLCAAAIVAFGMAAFAQETEQKPGAPQTQTGAQTTAAKPAGGQQMTLTGCIQREADFRKGRDAGKGGVAGTGVGAGNEFVLINASVSGGAAPAGTSGAAPGTATGTAGTAASGNAYELTGANEGQVEKFVGKRVEIMGTVKPAETTAAGKPTGGPTAGAPPRGVDVTSEDLQLRELEISSVKETTGNCPS
jgi:hypothetical protein